jgi:hypothetical protein
MRIQKVRRGKAKTEITVNCWAKNMTGYYVYIRELSITNKNNLPSPTKKGQEPSITNKKPQLIIRKDKMANKKRKPAGRLKRHRQKAPAATQHEITVPELAVTNEETILHQTDPPYTKPSIFRAKGWTDCVAGYIREARKLVTCILRNEALMLHPYHWHVTINYESVQTPAEIKTCWTKVCKKLKKSGVVALWVREVNRSNRVHYHLIVSNQIRKEALDQAVEDAMPPREVIPWHKRLQRIKQGETWQLAHYITKAQIAGYVDGRRVVDYYATKRLLFKPKLGLVKYRTIGDFWVKRKAAIWQVIKDKEKRIAEGLEKPGMPELVVYIYELLDQTLPLYKIERAFGYHAESEPVQRWIVQLLAGDDGGYESINS